MQSSAQEVTLLFKLIAAAKDSWACLHYPDPNNSFFDLTMETFHIRIEVYLQNSFDSQILQLNKISFGSVGWLVGQFVENKLGKQ